MRESLQVGGERQIRSTRANAACCADAMRQLRRDEGVSAREVLGAPAHDKKCAAVFRITIS
jgi:hypothetical protein